MKHRALAAVVVVLTTVLATSALPAAATTPTKFANWAGYGAYKSGVTFTDVRASFTVPTLTCNTSTNQYSSEWVGIDGFVKGDTTVEQDGIESDCFDNNKPGYYAWWETYPNPNHAVWSITLHPGDVIYTEVKYVDSKFEFILDNKTTGKNFTSPLAAGHSGFTRNSAEWIVEATQYATSPLPKFSTVTFWGANAIGNGHNGPISSSTWTNYQATMQAKGATVPSATTSSLDSTGAVFSVNWNNPCPRCT